MNEDTDRAQQMGELIADGRARGAQLNKLERSICLLRERVDKGFEGQVALLAQMRVFKWLVVIMVPTLIALVIEWWRTEV